MGINLIHAFWSCNILKMSLLNVHDVYIVIVSILPHGMAFSKVGKASGVKGETHLRAIFRFVNIEV